MSLHTHTSRNLRTPLFFSTNQNGPCFLSVSSLTQELKKRSDIIFWNDDNAGFLFSVAGVLLGQTDTIILRSSQKIHAVKNYIRAILNDHYQRKDPLKVRGRATLVLRSYTQQDIDRVLDSIRYMSPEPQKAKLVVILPEVDTPITVPKVLRQPKIIIPKGHPTALQMRPIVDSVRKEAANDPYLASLLRHLL